MNRIDIKLENSVIRIYEGLYRQVREAKENGISETDAFNDIEQKIDIIMDALGLVDDNDNKKENEENTNNEEIVDIELPDIDLTEEEEEEEENQVKPENEETTEVNFV